MSLKLKAITSVKWTTFSTAVTTIIQLAQIAVLARFLKPNDFGIMALAMVVIGFSDAFMDAGISNAIIHKQEISPEQLSSLYWLNVFSGIAVFLAAGLLSPLIASFYKEPELTPIIWWVSLTFVIQSFGRQFMILFQKELMFDIIARVEIISKFAGFLAAVVLAFQGFRVYALIFALLAATFFQAALFFLAGIKYHRPSFHFKKSDLRGFLRFGIFQMGEKTVNYFNTQLDVILIGKLLGAEALGIYYIAKQIIMRPAQIINPIITRVTFPLLARVQDDMTLLKNAYLKTINYLSSVNFPVHIFIAILAGPIVLILLGKSGLKRFC